jgi:hypothetical protein
MRVLVTHFFPRYRQQCEFFAMTCEFNRRVCERIGWKFFADSKRRVPDKNVWREKSAMIADTIEPMVDGTQVLWVDGDVLLVGDRLGEIFDAIAGFDYGMAKPFGRWNSGVVPMIVSPQIRRLWPEMRDHEHRPVGTLDDASEWTINGQSKEAGLTPLKPCIMDGDFRSVIQGASEAWDANACDTCPWPPEKRGPLCGSHGVKLALLDNKWNQRPDAVDENTQIIGWHRDTGFSKVRKIREYIEARK